MMSLSVLALAAMSTSTATSSSISSLSSSSAINFATANTLPAGPVTAKGTDLYVGSTRVRFHIATLTDNACTPRDPAATAAMLKSRGYNAVRLHHIDRGLREGWWTAAQITNFMDQLYANGIRVSIDLVSKRGETWMTG